MRFATFLLGAFAVVASAQSSDTTSAVSTTLSGSSTATSLTPAQSSQASCLAACDAGDVDCQAKCIAVPSPSGSQVNATTECVANCNQGNGTASDNDAYADCVQTCIDDNYFTSTGTPAQSTGAGSSDSTATGSSATATGTDDSSSTGTSTGGSSSSGTSTSSGSSSSSTDSAGDALRVGVTGMSLFGLLAAFAVL